MSPPDDVWNIVLRKGESLGWARRAVALKLSLHCEDVVPATARREMPRAKAPCINDVWTEVGAPIKGGCVIYYIGSGY